MLITVLVLAGLEGACRLDEKPAKYRPSALTGYELVPGYDSGHERVNAVGLRGRELRPRTDGTLRILCLGGSTTWGHKVDEDETWPARLQAELGDSVEVLNGGVSGWGLEHLVLSLEQRHLKALQPDLVLVYSGWNDPLREDNPQETRVLADLKRQPSSGLAGSSALGRWLLEKLADSRAVAAVPKRHADPVARNARHRARLAAAMPALMGRLGALSAERELPVLVLRYPALVQREPSTGVPAERAGYRALLDPDARFSLPWDELWAHAQLQWTEATRLLSESAVAAGLPVLDLAAELERSQSDDDAAWLALFRDRAHLSPEGNAAVAGALARLLLSEGYVAPLASR